MREINRKQFLYGTRAWTYRNIFVFGGLALTIISGILPFYMFPGLVDKVTKKTEEERKIKAEWRQKVLAIQERQRTLNEERINERELPFSRIRTQNMQTTHRRWSKLDDMKHKGAQSGPSEPRMSTPIQDMSTVSTARVVSPTKKSLGRKTKLSLYKAQGAKSQNFIPSVRLDDVINLNDSLDFQDSGSMNVRKRLPRHKYDNKKALDCVVNKAGDIAPPRKALGCALNTADQVSLGPNADSSKYVKDRHAVVFVEKFDCIVDMLQHHNSEMQSASTKPDGLSAHVGNRDLKLAAAPDGQNEALKRKHNILLKSDPEMEQAGNLDRAPYDTDVIKLAVSDAVNVSRDRTSETDTIFKFTKNGTSENDTIVEVTNNGTSEHSIIAMASKNNTTSAGAFGLTASGSCEGLQSSCEEVQDCYEENVESCSEGSLSTTQHTCPTCGQLFPRGCFVKHLKVCLQEQFGWKQQVLSDGGTGDKKQVMSIKGETLNAGYVFCPLCQKDITHLNSHRRNMHTNKCFDELDQKKQEEAMHQKALQAARMQVLNCPMCGKILHTQQSRKNHLKKCSAKLEVSTEQLLTLIKKQEEEHEANLAAGILSHVHRPAEKNQMRFLGHGIQKTSAPKSKLEEDTQLALALSSSLYPCSTTATSSSRSGPRKRKNEINKDDYLLYTLNSSQAAGRIANRVSDLLSQEMEEEERFVMLPAVDKNHLQHLSIKRLVLSQTEESEQKSFWKIASLSMEKMSGGKDNPRELFYVLELMPPVEISTFDAGSKLCGLSKIAGDCHSSESQTPGPRENRTEEKGAQNLPLTQTAFVLADMAAEAESISQNSSCFADEQSLGSEEDEHIAADDLISDFLRLVNQPAYSDAKIIVSSGQELHVHRLILSIRCPQLLQLVQDGSGIANLSAWSSDSVLALLRYLYGGLTNIEDRLLASTLDLAERLDVMGLRDVCQKRLWRSQQMVDICQDLGYPIEHSGRVQRDDNSVQKDEEVGVKDTKFVIRDCKILLNERSQISNHETNFKKERTFLKNVKPLIKEDKHLTNENKSPIEEDKTVIRKGFVLSKTQTPLKEDSYPLKEGICTPKEVETIVKERTKQDRTELYPSGDTTMLLRSNKNSSHSAIVSPVSEMNSCSASESVKTISGSYFETIEPLRTLHNEELDSDKDDDAHLLVLREEDSFSRGSSLRGPTANLTRDVTPPSDCQKHCNNHSSPAATSNVKNLHSSETFCYSESKDVERIEISDDDLFSDEDSDVSVLPSTPQVSLGKAAVWREKTLVTNSSTCVTSYNRPLSQSPLKRGKISESTFNNQPLPQSPLNRGKASESILKSPAKHSFEKRKHSPDHWLTDDDEKSVNFSKFSNLSKRQRTSNSGTCPESEAEGRVLKNKVFREERIQPSDFENLNMNVLDTECSSSLKSATGLQHSTQPSTDDASKQDSINLDSDALQYNEGPTLEKSPKSHCVATLFPQKKGRAEKLLEVSDRLASTSCDFSSCRKQSTKPALTSADICSSPQATYYHHSSCLVSPLQAHTISDNFGESRRLNIKNALDTVDVDEKTIESDSDLEIVDGCPGEISAPKFQMSGQPKYDQTEPPPAALEPSPTTYKPSLAAFEPEQATEHVLQEYRLLQDLREEITPSPVPLSTKEHRSMDTADSYSMPDDGVWEGFDDVEMHSPDLEVIGSVLDSLENKDNAMDCLVRSGPVKMADTLLKSVMSSVKIVDSPVLKHHQNQLSRPDIEYNHYGALLDSSVRERCSSPENVCGLLPDLHTRMGGFMTDADVAAYDNSFLWSEENAPELIISKEILPAFQCSQKTVKSSHGLPPKTPSQRLKKGQHVLVPPSPFTPMPDYDRMTTPQLKAEVQKFGVRPLGKRKMKCLLKDIYEKTHQYETDSELDEADLVADVGTETNKPGTCSQPLHRLSNPDARPLQKASHRKTKSRPLKTKSTGKRRGVDGERHTLAETMETEEVAIVRHRHSSGQTAKSPMKRGVVPVAGERERALSECSRSPDKCSLSSSQASDVSEQPDVNVFEEADDDDDVALSQQVSAADREQMIMNYIRGRSDLYEKVLTYEPLDLVVLKDDLKAASIRCGQQKLMDLLNAKCITFTNKNVGCWQRNTRGKWNKSKKPRAKNNS